MKNRNFEYDVGLSFAGEQREYVNKVAKELKSHGIRVFFDDFEKVKLWGTDLYEHLDEIYQNRCRYCVVFVSKQYVQKAWTNHERKSAQARTLHQREEYILPVRFDDTPVPGLRDTVHYLNAQQLAPRDLADTIRQKLGRTPHQNSLSPVSGEQKSSHRPHQPSRRAPNSLSLLPFPDSATLSSLPDLPPGEVEVMALLHLCPDPLPLEVVGGVSGKEITEVARTLQRSVQNASLTIEKDVVRLAARTGDGISSPSRSVVRSALEAALHFVKNHPDAAGRAQVMNVVALAKTADIHAAPVEVAHTFRTIQSLLKASGNKRLVLEVARRSIEASKALGRGREQVKDEAVACICGISWVYQRTGRLAEALVEAERSLELGRAIHWDRNTAFCNKCLGRLKRMESECAQDPRRRVALHRDSVELLREAIVSFTKLELESEVGDCYSLLARTYLVVGDWEATRAAIREADQRLVDSTKKDYLDLNIVKGDLMLHTNRRSAASIYTEVLTTRQGEDDAQKSEILARAYLHHGRVRSVLGDSGGAFSDFQQAAKIWDALEDPAADSAHWEIERTATWVDREAEELLNAQPVGVRVRAARIVKNETAARPIGRSHRGKLPREYLRGVISRAEEQCVVDRPVW